MERLSGIHNSQLDQIYLSPPFKFEKVKWPNKTCIVLIGPQGSGKTTFCQKYFSKFLRISQDDQGKQEHFNKFINALDTYNYIIIDRLNFSKLQRNRYVIHAKEHGYHIHFIWLNIDKETCLERLLIRKNHPTIAIDANHSDIINTYFSQFELPSSDEFDTINIINQQHNAKILDLSHKTNRMIVIGDIHGCYDELMQLLNKCNYNENEDIVISLGDLTDRGPKSLDVLKWFKNQRNTFVIEGNHDNKLKRYCLGRKVNIKTDLQETIEQISSLNKIELGMWIESWPTIIKLPNINGKSTYAVHAGIDSTLPIDKQKISTCLYNRYVGGKNFLDTAGDLWYTQFNGEFNIIIGHIVSNEYNPKPSVYCLDGGCFHGLSLRAMVIDHGNSSMVEVPGNKSYKRIITLTEERDNLVDQNLLRCDDLGPLRIYTYTQECKNWIPLIRKSRGIIINTKTQEIVAKSFDKFFGLNESEETLDKNVPWHLDHLIFEKADGWLGLLYRYNNEYKVSTIGSFKSPGAIWASDFLKKNYNLTDLPDSVTLVFELISPITKIIVDYGDKEDIVLLAAFNRFTDEEYPWEYVEKLGKKYNFTLPKVYTKQEMESILKRKSIESEGVVIRFSNNFRVKIKSEDYKKMAYFRQTYSLQSLLALMKNGRVSTEFLDQLQLEDVNFILKDIMYLEKTYATIEQECHNAYKKIEHAKDSRKEFSKLAVQTKHPHAMFGLLDKKDYVVEKYIMKKVRESIRREES